MERIIFADSREAFFAEGGFKLFNDFFESADGKIVSKSNKQDVIKLSLDDGAGGDKVFFMKRFHGPHFKEALVAFCNFGRFCSQAECEWRNAKLLFENGIDTYRPVCYGERTRCGIKACSFIVTEQLGGEALSDFVGSKWRYLTDSQKAEIITAMGQFVRRIHNARISLPDLYIWHIFIKEKGPGRWDFAVIDLHRMKHNITSENRMIRNLGRLSHSMIDKYFDDTMRRLFVRAYAGDNRASDIDRLIDKVQRCSDAVSSMREPKPY